MFRAEKYAFNVYRHQVIPFLFGDLMRGTICARNPGIIDEHIDSAKVLVHSLEDCFHFGLLPNIKVPELGFATRALDVTHRLPSIAIEYVRYRHKCAFARQEIAGGSPNAQGSARHDRNFPFNPVHSSFHLKQRWCGRTSKFWPDDHAVRTSTGFVCATDALAAVM